MAEVTIEVDCSECGEAVSVIVNTDRIIEALLHPFLASGPVAPGPVPLADQTAQRTPASARRVQHP
jgi:hypothetical protein